MIDYKSHIMRQENARYRTDAHYDGKTGIAIGYSLDLVKNTITITNKQLHASRLFTLTLLPMINQPNLLKVLFNALQPTLNLNQVYITC